MNFNKIAPSDITADISWKIEGGETSYLPIKSDDVLVWKNWSKDKSSFDSKNSVHLMYGYLKNKFGMELTQKTNGSIILEATLPSNTNKDVEKTFETILKSFFKMAGFSLGKTKKSPTGKHNLVDYFEYLDGMTNEEALSVVKEQNENKLTEAEKVKKAEELIFSFSKSLWTEAQVKARVDQILDLKVDLNLINPANRDENRHPKQWFLDLLNYTNLSQWEAAHDDGFNHAAEGNWVNNAVAMAVALLPHVRPIPLLELDGKEYKPNLNYGGEIGQWNISASRAEDKDILDIIGDETFTKYDRLPKEHFFILLEHLLSNNQLTKKKATSMSYRIMFGHDSSIWDCRFNDKELARAYTALINATPGFSKDDIGWRLKDLKNRPETLSVIDTLVFKNDLENSLESNQKPKTRKNKA